MWTLHTDSGNNVYGGQSAKNIYLGETRIVTKLNSGENPTYQEEYYKQYFYHSDHLGSASLISDYKGDEYQRIEYTPYGETWVEKTQNQGLEFLPYKFTAKELDEETGLYYYGARYLDPKYSMWISTDPALGEYIPKAPIDEEAKKYNQNLPGMGGVFNHINSNLYHYAGNNPVKYTDPDGRFLHIVIGAAIGGTVAAAVSAATQYAKDGKIDRNKVLLAAAGGAISGGLAASGVGLVGQVLVNGCISLTQDAVTQFVFEDKNLSDADYLELGMSFVTGCAAGWLGGKGADSSHIMASSTRQLLHRMGNAFKYKSGNDLISETGKALAYYFKTNGIKSITKDSVVAILKGTIPSAINLGAEIYKKAEAELKELWKDE